MYRIGRAEVWGGIRDCDEDVRSSGLTASLYARACAGGRGGDVHYLSVCARDLLTRVVVADVAGHGPAVAEVAHWLGGALEGRMNDIESHALLAELNEKVAARGAGSIATAAVVAFYRQDSNLYYAYAGHAPLLVRRAGRGRWEPAALDPSATRHPNAPLGVLPGALFDQHSTRLGPGDRLFLHTDGLTETPAANRERFGSGRLLGVLEEAAERPLPELKRAVLDAVLRHAGGRGLDHDDVTLLAMEVN